MSRLASASDFEGGVLYDDYHRFPFFATRADKIVERFPNIDTILVAGCGWGFVVDELIQRGKIHTWGVDAAAYCQDKASAMTLRLKPGSLTEFEFSFEVSTRILVGDCTKRADLAVVKTTAGLLVNQKFDLIITDDMLTVCNSEDEVRIILTELRRIGTNICHVITPGNPADPNDIFYRYPGLLWLTVPQWQLLINDASEPILVAEGNFWADEV